MEEQQPGASETCFASCSEKRIRTVACSILVSHALGKAFMTVRLMRTPLPSRLLRAHHAVKPAIPAVRCRIPSGAPGAEVTTSQPCSRSFANIREPDFTLKELSFSGTGPRGTPEGPKEGDYKPPDERTLKLGKSKSDQTRPCHSSTDDVTQLSKPSTTVSQPCSLHPYLKRSSPHKSHYTSSPPRIRISQPSPAEWHTMQRYGPHQWPGAASRSSAT